MESPIQIWIIGGEEGQKVEGRDCHSLGRSLTNSAASRAEEDAEEATQNYQEGLVMAVSLRTTLVAYSSLASKQRQVKRGVKEVVKAIRKGEKGYVA